MSLPYLKRKQMVGVISQKFAANGIKQPEDNVLEQEAPKDQGLDFCSADLIRAVQANDITGVSAALRAAFELMESEPHEEGSGEESEGSSYDALNAMAGKEQR